MWTLPAMMMNQGKSENGENRQIKWIYLFTVFIGILITLSYIIFNNYQDQVHLNPSKPNSPCKPKHLYSLEASYSSDEDFEEDEVFAEFKVGAFDSSKIKKDLTSDFIEKLEEVPMRSKVPVGVVKRGDSNYASTVIQVLFRIPMVRKVLANLEVYKEFHELQMKKLREEYEKIEKSNDKDKEWNLREIDEDIKFLIAAKDVATGLNDMFSRLQSSENNVKFHSENLLKLKFFENFSNFKLVGNYYKLILDYLFKLVPDSQHNNFIIHYKDTCQTDCVNSDKYDENLEKAILEFDLNENENENEKTLSDLMKSKFLQTREQLEWHGPPVMVTRQYQN